MLLIELSTIVIKRLEKGNLLFTFIKSSSSIRRRSSSSERKEVITETHEASEQNNADAYWTTCISTEDVVGVAVLATIHY